MVRTTPDDDFDRKLLSDVETHGWHLVGIDDDAEGPTPSAIPTFRWAGERNVMDQTNHGSGVSPIDGRRNQL